MFNPRLIALTCTLALCAGAAHADLVYLKSGKILDGEVSVADNGEQLELKGPNGTLVLSKTLVERFELGATLGALVEGKMKATGGDADKLYQLGRWFAAHGMGEQANVTWRRAIEVKPDHVLARRALGQVKQGDKWVAHHELMKAAGLVRRGSRWVVPTKQAETVFEKAPKGAAARLAWANERLPAVTRDATSERAVDRAKAHLARRQVVGSIVELLLRDGEAANREKAARFLGAHEEDSAVLSLVRSAVADRSEQVRKAAVEALDQIDRPKTATLFLKPLEHPKHEVRANAIQALGMLQQNDATNVLVKTLTAVYGGGPRVHIFVGNRLSYIKDYDVEVADQVAVGDPEVGYVTDGVVLDVKVLRIVEYITVRETHLIAQALEKRTGEKFGPNPQKWIAWWNKEQRKKN